MGHIRPKPTQKENKASHLRQTWQEIPQDDIRQLINAMPRKVLSLKTAKRMSTKYWLFNLCPLIFGFVQYIACLSK